MLFHKIVNLPSVVLKIPSDVVADEVEEDVCQ
jgi:hypothetical protein